MMFGLTKPDETITVKPFEVFQKELVLTSSYINLIRSVARSSSSTLAARRILDGRQGGLPRRTRRHPVRPSSACHG